MLKDYINNFTANEVVERMTELYPDESENNLTGYRAILEHMRTMTPTISDVNIHIVELEDEGEKYHHVFGTVVEDELTHALGWTNWEEWLGMSIEDETLTNYNPLDILVHCIWDMTFYGWNDEAIQKVIDQCTDAKEECESFKTMEEFIENLE